MTNDSPTVKAVIHLEHNDPHDRAPWPIGIDENKRVTSGLGPDDGASLIGFGPAGSYDVTVFAEAALANPESVVGLVATFGNGGMFSWNVPVARLEVR
ncbi:hypothetical protein [Leifsonia aquatica]|uniref:hypothetical protein n=1 Tax=Leifsonia aquatica TaxID=144185 RepID=UPI000469B70C|nr:hypothetical protein [Leifsonia aquatica]